MIWWALMMMLLHSLWEATIRRKLWQAKPLNRVVASYEEEMGLGVEWLKVCDTEKNTCLPFTLELCDRPWLIRHGIIAKTMRGMWHPVICDAWSRRRRSKNRIKDFPPLIALIAVPHCVAAFESPESPISIINKLKGYFTFTCAW